jgi:hypothetical protein
VVAAVTALTLDCDGRHNQLSQTFLSPTSAPRTDQRGSPHRLCHFPMPRAVGQVDFSFGRRYSFPGVVVEGGT